MAYHQIDETGPAGPGTASERVTEMVTAAVTETVTAAVTQAVFQAAARFDVTVGGLRVRLAGAGGRIVAQANARAAGRPVRAQVAARTAAEAAGDLGDRLSRRILEAAACWSPKPWPDADDASVPSRIPPVVRAAGPGRVARVKRVPLSVCPPEVAVTVMDRLDYPAHLFVDAGTGLDAVVYRAGPSGYRLARLRPAAPPAPNAIPLTVDPRPAPVLELDRAVRRLDETGLGHLFHVGAETGRGQLLYRRFDGRYGLVVEAG